MRWDGVACAAGGLAAGATQVVRGIANTPDAMQQATAQRNLPLPYALAERQLASMT